MATAERAEGEFRVLVIDDNRDAADTLARLLRIWGYTVRTVYTGNDAIEAAEGFLPDCIIADIGLPGLNGYELARELRHHELFGQTPLIANSARPDRDKAKAAGFDHCLVKPASASAVADLLEELRAMKKRLEQVEEATRSQGEVVGEVRDLMKEVKSDVKEIKVGLQTEVKELKSELREVKEEVREIREDLKEAQDAD